MLKSLLKETGIYGFGNVLKKFFGFLLVPIYTRYLAPADYGILDSLGVFVSLSVLIFGLGIPGATKRYFFIADSQYEKARLFL